jgi:opacity protein-like surface antigen
MKLTALVCGVAVGSLLLLEHAQAAGLTHQPAPAMAQNGEPYFGVKGGVSWVGNDPAFACTQSPLVIGGVCGGAADTAVIDLKTGFDAGMMVGYSFADHWGVFVPRVELEFGYLSNDVNTVTLAVGGVAGTANPDSSEINAFYGLASLLLDIPTGWGFNPFIGGGVGFANVRLDHVGKISGLAIIGPGSTFIFDEEDTAFAWNLTAGLSFDISRNITLDIAYRFLQFSSVDILDPGTSLFSSDDIDNHQVNLGVRVRL